MEKEISVITGAGSGIGQALAWNLAKEHNLRILAIGRRISYLEETKNRIPERINILAADVSKQEDRLKIVSWLINEKAQIRFLVHNAAVLEPVKPLIKISLQEWRTHQAINVEGPLFLTQALAPFMQNSRILHISSGAAHHPYEGWGAYCTSKAALNMIYRVLHQEVSGKKFVIGSARPGVVDTPMQNRVRSAEKNIFPDLEKFIILKEENKLYSPQRVARFLAYLLLKTNDQEFSSREWDIHDTDF